MLTFEESTHTYTLDGQEIPSVTQVLKAEGFINTDFIDPWYAERGTAVHKATELFDLGTLDESSLDPRIVGYLEAWKKYRRDTGYTPDPDMIERRMYHPTLKYAGTIDRPGLDIKSGSPEPWHVIQAAGYEDLMLANTDDVSRGWSMIYLKEDGTYKVKPYSAIELYQARRIFHAALACYNYKRNNKIKEKSE